MTPIHWTLRGGAVACLTTSVAAQTQAAPWFEPGDTYARFKLQQAADRDRLDATISTWPLSRSNARLSSDENDEADVLQWNGLAGPTGGDASLSVSSASNPRFIRGFEGGTRETGEVDLSFSYIGDTVAVNFSPSYVPDPTDDDKVRYDGSYLAATQSNWTLGAGYIDRWWGPGWQSSMILSSNARPTPSVWLDRRNTHASESKWLNWIGPWQFTGFVGRLEEDRYVPDANLIGMRLAFRPLSGGLEVGLSRLIQWGGEGRLNNSDSFIDALLGRDNIGSDGIADDRSADPGNQLAAFDLRYGFELGESTVGIYMQTVGEDEANKMPSRRSYQFGVDWTTGLFSSQQQWFLEAVETTSDSLFRSGEHPNYAYEHGNYRSGMRYLGRNLANTFDSDARALTLGLFAFFTPVSEWSASLTYADLNRDGASRFQKGAGTDTEYFVPAGQQQVTVLDLSHSRPLFGGEASFFVSLSSDEIDLADETLRQATAGFEWQRNL